MNQQGTPMAFGTPFPAMLPTHKKDCPVGLAVL